MDPFTKSESPVIDDKSITYQIQSAGVEPDTAAALAKAFEPFERQAKEWAETALALVVTDSGQVAEMKQAREARLALRQIRLDIDKTHKTLKADSLKKGQLLDLIKRTLTGFVEPIESHLQAQEDFAKLQEEKRRKELYEARVTSLSRFMAESEVRQLPLGDMPEESFNNFLEGTEAAYNRRQKQAQEDQERLRREAEEKAEADRKIREENERLKKEHQEIEATQNAYKIRREKRIAQVMKLGMIYNYDYRGFLRPHDGINFHYTDIEGMEDEKWDESIAKVTPLIEAYDAKQREIEANQKQKEAEEKAKTEAKLKQEREDRKRLEREHREREEKEEGERKAKAAADRKARRAPDKVKLLAFADRIELLESPSNLKDEEAQKILNDAIGLLAKVINYVRTKSENL